MTKEKIGTTMLLLPFLCILGIIICGAIDAFGLINVLIYAVAFCFSVAWIWFAIHLIAK
jgi:uncharacterized membrane protein YbjE (DUF340 family)